MSIKQKTISGLSWSFIESSLGQGITFIVGLVLARLLSPGEYGLIGIITIFIALFNSIVDSGFSNALIRKNDATNIDYDTVFLFNLILSAFLFVLLFLSAPLISNFFNQIELISLTRVMSLILIINAFTIVQRTILIKRINFKTQTKISVIASLLSGVVGISMALMGMGVWSLAGQQISRQLINSILLWVYSNYRPQLRFSKTSFIELFTFGYKVLLVGIINTLWKQLYLVVIGKWYSTPILGQYTRATGFTRIFSDNLNSVVQRVSYPVLSSLQNDPESLKKGYRKIIKGTMYIAFVSMFGLAAVAKPMVLVLIGEKWLPSVEYLQIVCFSAVLYPLHSLNLNMLQVKGHSGIMLKLEIIKKTIAVGPIILGIFIDIKLMLWGSVITGIIAYYLNSMYSGRDINYGMKEQVLDIIPSFLVSIVAAFITWLLAFLSLPVFIIFAIQIIVYTLLVIILSEFFKLEEYFEIKLTIMNFINKGRKV